MGLTVIRIFCVLVAATNPTRFTVYKNIGFVRRSNGQKASTSCGTFMKTSTDTEPQP